MISKIEKIKSLQNYLEKKIDKDDYAGSFRNDIEIFIDEFVEENPLLKFLDNLSTKEEIESWVDSLISQIVMKFDEEQEQINDFICEYMI